MTTTKDKIPKQLINGERLAELLKKLEELRHEEHLSLGEYEFLMKLNASMMREIGKHKMTVTKAIAQAVEDVSKKNGNLEITPTIV